MRRRDPSAPLVRALLADAAAAGCIAAAVGADSREWSSATFTGRRHAITLSAPAGRPLVRWLRALPDATFALPRQVLGEIAVGSLHRSGGQHRITLCALTLDDC